MAARVPSSRAWARCSATAARPASICAWASLIWASPSLSCSRPSATCSDRGVELVLRGERVGHVGDGVDLGDPVEQRDQLVLLRRGEGRAVRGLGDDGAVAAAGALEVPLELAGDLRRRGVGQRDVRRQRTGEGHVRHRAERQQRQPGADHGPVAARGEATDAEEELSHVGDGPFGQWWVAVLVGVRVSRRSRCGGGAAGGRAAGPSRRGRRGVRRGRGRGAPRASGGRWREAAGEQGQGELEVERVEPRCAVQEPLAQPARDVLEGGA